MKTPYLIQRMIRKENPPKNPTIDDLYSMDYMGSSEFEWGALPKSLKVFTKGFEDLEIRKTEVRNFKDEPLFLLGFNTEEYSRRFISDLFTGKMFLKERLEHEYAMNGEAGLGNVKQGFKPFHHTSAWWDIDNHVMMTFKKLHINKLKAAIGVVRENKIREKEKDWY